MYSENSATFVVLSDVSSEPHMLTKIQPFLFHVNFNNINKMLPCLTEFYLFSFSCQPLPQHSQINEKFSYFRFMSISQENVTIPDGISSILVSHARLLYKTHILTRIQPSSVHINLTLKKFGIVSDYSSNLAFMQFLPI